MQRWARWAWRSRRRSGLTSVKKTEDVQSATLRRIQRRRKLAGIRKAIIASALFAAALVSYCYVGRLPYPVSELAEFAEFAERVVTPAAQPDSVDVAAVTPRKNSLRAVPTPAIPIDQSDTFVRQVSSAISSHPHFAASLINDGLIRRFAAFVASISEGLSPRKQVEFLTPESPFLVIERGDRIFVDPRSGERYDLLAEVFASLKVDAVATVYRRLRPLLFLAYSDLGYPNGDFDAALGVAIEELWMTPAREGEIELVRARAGYRFADPKLEAMSDAQKQFFRIGSRNQRIVRTQLVAIAQALDLMELQPPPSHRSAALGD
jgi:hypothetical protein